MKYLRDELSDGKLYGRIGRFIGTLSFMLNELKMLFS
jgi:hypothetical protein